MSLCAHSPFSGGKRLFDDNVTQDNIEATAGLKRARFISSPAGRCAPSTSCSDSPAYAVSATTLKALCALFPDMDEKVIVDVLDNCGDNIDAAIRRLGELRITATPFEIPQNGAHSSPSATSDNSPAPSSPLKVPESHDEWVELLISEMAAAIDVQDARHRASSVLQKIERFVTSKLPSHSPGLISATQSRLEELCKENQILKKAVQIQNARMQEKSHLEEEMQHLRALVSQYEEQLRKAELHNYSLTLHLQKATAGNTLLPSHRHPDVF